VLTGFSEIARGREGEAAARRYKSEADRLARNLETAWLGDRYALASMILAACSTLKAR